MKLRLIPLWLCVCAAAAAGLWLPGHRAGAAPADDTAARTAVLQLLIDRTPAGGLLRLPPGSYEGPAVITRPIVIEGQNGAVVGNKEGSGKPAITVGADDVTLSGLQIVQDGKGASSDTPAVLVQGSRTWLHSLDIRTGAFGILLRDTGNNRIENNSVVRVGSEAAKLSERRNGIDLFNAHDNIVSGNKVSSMNDGIYLESSHRNKVEANSVEHSRYGIHCMYTKGTVVRGNTGIYNVTGAMIMGVKEAEVSGNSFTKQSESVNSQGLLFFDVHNSKVTGNKVEGNRVGLYVEQSGSNDFTDNDVLQNFVGVQFLESENNRFTGNRFIGNVIEAEADAGESNAFSGNFWEAIRGLDSDGDGRSELSYALNPFFQRLTGDVPAYQLFFQSPGMQFLEGMYTSGREGWTKDEAPLMKPGTGAEQKPESGVTGNTTLLFGLLLLLASVSTIYYVGVKRV
ncbi:nitrous oxide reductase family maturation protein NosD [Paenibacillus sp. UNC499MF]|uniref:right-handed parallel beta-helix repeat-containing protein n=1 Tax=Paenibacillus sp. UNC499MF TaxID=1502751 RepID=UPI0008A04DA6|nr:NosD domain-containing protein [Paenibacillus sp. UNC499MF]SEF62449.1 nitrous oxidase accessory protein [Paenibacillus sp. UNC499MF]